MAKDERLYARFDIAMDEHPKVMLLSDTAFRALIESTMYSRRQLTDGFLAAGVVLKKWGTAAADELSANHPDRPSWLLVEGGYQIRDYEKHQTTNDDIEKKRESGRLGGLARAERIASEKLAGATEVPKQKGSTILAKTETETETKSKDLSTDGERESAPKSPYSAAFNEWWAHYPKKESKGDAWKAWEMIRKERTLPDLPELIAAAKNYATRQTDAKFQKLPGGWLRDRKWEDDLTAQPKRHDPNAWMQRPRAVNS